MEKELLLIYFLTKMSNILFFIGGTACPFFVFSMFILGGNYEEILKSGYLKLYITIVLFLAFIAVSFITIGNILPNKGDAKYFYVYVLLKNGAETDIVKKMLEETDLSLDKIIKELSDEKEK